jgi:hypothetical protein
LLFVVVFCCCFFLNLNLADNMRSESFFITGCTAAAPPHDRNRGAPVSAAAVDASGSHRGATQDLWKDRV